MQIGVAYAGERTRRWLRIEVPEGVTVREAIERSGLLQQFPEIDLETQRVGVFGRLTKLDAAVSDGDRVEIYRPVGTEAQEAAQQGR